MANKNIISQRPKIIPPDYGSSSSYSDPFEISANESLTVEDRISYGHEINETDIFSSNDFKFTTLRLT